MAKVICTQYFFRLLREKHFNIAWAVSLQGFANSQDICKYEELGQKRYFKGEHIFSYIWPSTLHQHQYHDCHQRSNKMETMDFCWRRVKITTPLPVSPLAVLRKQKSLSIHVLSTTSAQNSCQNLRVLRKEKCVPIQVLCTTRAQNTTTKEPRPSRCQNSRSVAKGFFYVDSRRNVQATRPECVI